jgi:hypothetical protein
VDDLPLTLFPARRLLLVVAFCCLAAWLAGPAVRLPLAMALLGLGPGYLLERALFPARPHLLIRLALWVGLSLSLVALVFQWLWPLGLSLGGPSLGLLALALAFAALLVAWRDLAPSGHSLSRSPARLLTLSPSRSLALWPSGPLALSPSRPLALWLLLALITALTVWTRFEQIEGLALPAWVDSVHHTLMVRVALESGAAPTSLEPYMPVASLPYHWGYHVFVAAVIGLSGVALADGVLWSGQILNALHAPLAGAFAMVLWRRPLAAVGAALAVGLISSMPAYYLSWGRYTQLTGLLLLPGLAFAWSRGLEGGERRAWAAAALLLAGLSLIHMRVTVFALVLLAAQSLVWAAETAPRNVGSRVLGAVLTGLGAAFLASPWLALLARRALLPAVAAPSTLLLGDGYDVLNLAILWIGHNRWLGAIALLALLLGLWRRISAAAVLPIWVAGLFLLANPRLLGYLLPALGAALLLRAIVARSLPGALAAVGCMLLGQPAFAIPSTWLLNNDSVVISLFLPLGAAVGGGAALLYEAATRAPHTSIRRGIAPLGLALMLALAGWGAMQLRSVVNENTVIATPADRAAVAWVAANTPADARFLINATPWLGVAHRATDGGWWLLPLAERWVSTPPVLFTYGPPDYVEASIARVRVVAGYTAGGEQAILDLIRRDGIDYLYFGPKTGPLKPEAFTALSGFRTVYRVDGVTILAVDF